MVLIAASFWHTRMKYGQRGLRFVLMEAGHVCQNLLLAAASLDLRARAYGGFVDDELAACADLDGVNEAPLYLVGLSD